MITDATANTYTQVAADAGKFVSVKVTATNATGSLSRWSATTAVVAGLPVNSVAPAVTGTATVSQVLTVSNGTWSESPSSYSYQWLRCTAVQVAANAVPAVCTAISGATSNTYTLVSADATRFVVAAVTATNANGSVGKWSASTAAVAALLTPTNTVSPTVSGTARVGNVLTAANGTWGNFPASYGYEWLRCTAVQVAATTQPAACSLITDATANTYTQVAADAGKFVSVKVTATNATGSLSRWSASSAAVTGLPVNSVVPVVTGTNKVSQVLTVSNGTWSESPTSFTYQWLRCSARQTTAADAFPSSCSFITGAQSATYTLAPADAGKWVIAAVSAANSVATGTKWSASASTAVAELPPPTNTTAPRVIGNARIGEYVTVGVGVWTESPSSYSYQWFQCDEPTPAESTLAENCYEIEDGTSWQYVVAEADAGLYLLAEVTARNSTGSATHYSATSAMVPGLPVVISEPEILGTSLVGVGLQAEAGYWDYWDYSDDSTDELEFQWLRCDQPSEFSLEIPETCEPIMFEDSAEYWVTDDDEGHYIVLAVTATNGIGSSEAFSASTLMVEYGIVVSGYLTADDDGEPVAFENIRFENLENWMLSGSAVTDEYGYFEVSLYAGEYFISLDTGDDTFVSGPLPGGSWDSAEVYTITEQSEQTELNLTVLRSGSVSGCLYGESQDEWLDQSTGGLSLWKQSYGDTWFEVASHDPEYMDFNYDVESDQGDCLEYLFRGVAPGAYKLFVGDPGEQDPLDERMWFGDATTPDLGEWIVVESSVLTEVSDIELTLNTGSTPAKAPVLTRTVTSVDEVKYSWTKPQSAAPILGYYLENGCGYWGDSWYVMGADSLEINWGDWFPDRPTVCNFSVRAITTTGHGYTSVVTWSHGTTQQGPELTISDISATGFNVIAQSGAADSESYWFVLSGEGVVSDQASVVGQLYDEAGLYTAGDPYAVEYTDLVPGKTYTLKVANTYPDYNFTNWTTTTITLRSAPINTVPPVITGTARVANPLAVSASTWTESPTAFTYQWLRCREASAFSLTKPATCAVTLNQPQSTYTSTKADAGFFLVAAVSAENEYGLTTVYTASTQEIAGLPVNTVAPALTGTARYKNTLTASRGTWIESPIAYTYQWYKCQESSVVSSVKPQTCELVTGAKSSKYAAKAKDLGYFLVAAVTARNSIGSTTRWSASSLAIAGLPVNTVAPAVSGETQIGSEMTLSVGTWTESPTSYSYQWFHCDEATAVSSVEPDVCYAINGATSWRYLIDVSDAGKYLVAEVTARNSLGSAVKYSASSAVVAGLPVPLNPPGILGTSLVGVGLQAQSGYWDYWDDSDDSDDYMVYQWLRCDEPSEFSLAIPDTCMPIMFEDGFEYWVTGQDEGHYIVLAVTATNGIGSTVAYSASTSIVEYGIVVSGFVTAEDNGEALAFEYIEFENLENWMLRGSAYTDEYGYFEVALFAGDYIVSLNTQDDTLVSGYLPSGVRELADVYSITEETELNLTVQRAGSITGSIVSSVDGELVGDVSATLYAQIPNGGWARVAESNDQTPGLVAFDGVAPGTYRLFIGNAGEDEPEYQMQWFGNASSPEASTPVVVTADGVTDLSEIVMSPNPGRLIGPPPVVSRTVLPSGQIRFTWNKPVLSSPVLGYSVGYGCAGWGDGTSVVGADSLSYTVDSGLNGACSFSVTPFTARGSSNSDSLFWSSNTTVEGPILTVSNVSSTGFTVTAQARTGDSTDYNFGYKYQLSAITSETELSYGCGFDEQEPEPGAPCTRTITGLVPGSTFDVYVANRYGDGYETSGWSTITVRLPLSAARALAVSRE